jgi:hypothetical protein
VQPSSLAAEHTGLADVYRSAQTSRLRSFAALESEQKIWRWIFVGLLAVSFIEMALAGWLTRCPSNLHGEQK